MTTAKFTKIENDVLEVLMSCKLSAAELQVALAILRKTNGWSKSSDEISYSQLIALTGRSRQTISNCLKQLQLVNIIRLVKKGTSKKQSNEWLFNKNVSSWELVNRIRLVKFPESTSLVFDTELVKLSRHTKDTTKERLQKKEQKRSFLEKINKAFEEFWKLYPKKKGKSKAKESFIRIFSGLKSESEADVLFKRILSSVSDSEITEQWQEVQFIPFPTTWLNQRRWEDEIDPDEFI